MTVLGDSIARQIETGGPIPVSHYMALCLFDPEHGYYTTREPIGAAGDFITAPEISQMFGELVAVWLCAGWAAADRPGRLTLAEIGPGRGTLSADIVRTLRQVEPAMVEAADIVLVETSPRLRGVQEETLKDISAAVRWVDDVAALPDQPLFIAGNEIFDAIPVRQYVKAGGAWVERMVGLGEDGALRFLAGAGTLDEALLPSGADEQPDGTIFEVAPQRAALMGAIAARIAYDGGGGLFFDYGHLEPGFGDTFQAVRAHQSVDVLADPGLADLTSHVDFHALADVACREGLRAAAMDQGAFLGAMGIAERAGQLGAGKPAEVQRNIVTAVERLCATEHMGRLFKVLGIYPQRVLLPPFDTKGESRPH